MLCKWRKLCFSTLIASFLLNGLCLPAQANTTIAVTSSSDDVNNNTTPLPSIALLLPSHSGPLGAAADAVRTGFLTAYERDKNGLSVTVIEIPDTPAEMLSAYLAASAEHDILVGPLSRTGLTAIVQSGKVQKPTIALTQPEFAADQTTELPAQLLPIGLSIEAEARQIANWVSDSSSGNAFALTTGTAWQHRTANAFVEQAKSRGLNVELVSLNHTGSTLSTTVLMQLQQRIQTEKPSFLFLALNADQAKQVRNAIGNTDTQIYGISQLHSQTLNDTDPDQRLPELDGIRLIDLPWLLQSDHPAVMIYPRQIVTADQQRNADLERLYALGIDAFRVAHEVATHNTVFQIDGVTGKLNVRFGAGISTFERIEPTAIYQDGVVVPLYER